MYSQINIALKGTPLDSEKSPFYNSNIRYIHFNQHTEHTFGDLKFVPYI